MSAGWAPPPFEGAEPGDIFFTPGGGLVGWAIRFGTHAPYAHCGVLHTPVDTDTVDDDLWRTVEAYPPRVHWRTRRLASVARVIRVWRTERQRERLLQSSSDSAGLGYAYGEIAAIIATGLLPRPLEHLVPVWDHSGTQICSNHVARAIQAARPDAYPRYFRFPPERIWPAAVEYDANRLLWQDERGAG